MTDRRPSGQLRTGARAAMAALRPLAIGMTTLFAACTNNLVVASGGASATGGNGPSSSGGNSGGTTSGGACHSDPSDTPDCCLHGDGCYDGWFCDLSSCQCSQGDPCAGSSGGSSSCRSDPSGVSDCCHGGQGCYGNWFCDLATCQCSPTDPCAQGGTGGGASGGTTGGSTTGAITVVVPAPSGSVGPGGGSVSRLLFGVIGDTRPANPDDTGNYPVNVASRIFEDLQAFSPRPEFVIATGDYMFAQPGNGQAAPQATLYLQAAQNFQGQLFPAMGNHECTGYTASNCGPGSSDGVTENYTAFLTRLLNQGFGIQSPTPYYEIDVDSNDRTDPWTAKLVFIAANAWNPGQAAWLQSALARATTYTFVVRHEPDYDDGQCAGCSASDAIVKANPYTLLLTGHDHIYRWVSSSSELVVGIGGAQISSGLYGYVVCGQRSDDDIVCEQLDWQSNGPSYPSATIVVTPAGQPTQ
ncbi:MAG: metallophosphoesterase family protein [Deltaproteobacteria bacterium]